MAEVNQFGDPIVGTPKDLPPQSQAKLNAFGDPYPEQPQVIPPPTAPEQSMWEKTKQFAGNIMPESEDLPELSTGPQWDQESHETYGRSMVPEADFQVADTPVGMMKLANKRIANQNKMTKGNRPLIARVDQDQYGNPIAVDATGEKFYFNRPGPSGADIDLTQIGLERIAPAMAGGPLGNSAKTMLGAAGRFGLVEGINESLYQGRKAIEGAEEGYDYKTVTTAAAFAMGGELAGRMLTPVVGRLWNKMFGKVDDVAKYFDGENWTDEGIELLRRNEVDPGALDQMMRVELQAVDAMNPEQAARYNFMTKQGMKPTKAQVTQSRTDFANQQQLVRSDVGDEVRDILDDQNILMINKADAIKGKTGGITNLRQTTSADVSDYVTKRALADDAAVSQYYKVVRDRLPQQKIIKTPNLFSWIKQNASKNEMSQGAIRNMWGDLQARGVIDKKGNLVGRVSADVAEEIRKNLNQIYATGNPTAKTLATQAKDALDKDVFAYLGKDEFKSARAAKRKFHALYTDFKQHKLQKRGGNILEKLYDGSINQDRAFDKIIHGNVDDLKRLKQFMIEMGDEDGALIWKNMKAQVVEDAIQAATKGGKTQTGHQLWNEKAFKNVIDGYTNKGKLNVLFEPDEITELLDIMKLGRLRTPIIDSAGSTALGHGPSAPAIERATNMIAEILQRSPSPMAKGAAEVTRKGGAVVKKQFADAHMRELAQEAVSPSKSTMNAINKGLDAQKAKALGSVGGPTGGLSALGAHQVLGDDEKGNTQ